MGTVFGDNEEGEEKMSTKTLFAWNWETWEGYKGESRIVRRTSKRDKRSWSGIEIQIDLIPKHTKYALTLIEYKGIKAIIDALVEEHGKEEVEKALGIKIK